MQRPGTIGLERKMVYRTRTYIAADWDGDRDAVEQLHKWNDSNYWGFRSRTLTTYSSRATPVCHAA